MLKLISPQTENSDTQVRINWLIGLASSVVVLAVAVLLLAPRESTVPVAYVARLPRLNAGLNSATVLVLSIGYLFIRRKQVKLHRLCMLTAFVLSILFLISYVIYHAVAGSTSFSGSDWARTIYYPVLISHIILAIFLLPLSLTTLYRAWRQDFVRHKRLARWTVTLWLYVSASGVAVYWMLYHLPV